MPEKRIFKRTKIICTIGPSSIEVPILSKLYFSGMDCVRINTAHGDFAQYEKIVANARAVSSGLPIMVDIKGPEIRTRLATEELKVFEGNVVDFSFSDGSPFFFSYNFLEEVPKGARILIEDGNLSAVLSETDGKKRGKLTFEVSGTIKPNKNVNIPGFEIKAPLLSKNDREAISWAVTKGLDFIALSFVRSASDVENVRRLIPKGSRIKIISKIEDNSGVSRIDEIIRASDGVMIARGDLGVEVPSERIPIIQKDIIRKCNRAGKIAITATQMLDSMVSRPRPTRAETSDVANAVLDGTDVVMLSGETSTGKYPVESVREMAKIVREVEGKVEHWIENCPAESVSVAVSAAINSMLSQLPITKIVTITSSGHTAQSISRYRPSQEILGVTRNETTARQLALSWGVLPVLFAGLDREHRISSTIDFLLENKLIVKSDLVVFAAGTRTKRQHSSNLIELHYVDDLIDFLKS